VHLTKVNHREDKSEQNYLAQESHPFSRTLSFFSQATILQLMWLPYCDESYQNITALNQMTSPLLFNTSFAYMIF